ncbi:MAG: sigma-54 dependent transcriptional regulator [candidate division KSB1 bacterium]|nr:sigma-54 dependent transcriptional regulator [candidate division KSB1 bacterium]MDZ7294491.1 sigma-54 dependent transcriptional regulator [candidate division KSB1 bacterium]MDZ7384883.1 sigma-54 dependent transcriptional regulator [candidate division KSB1 bacterium]MDZ7391434.1 sigma-54 dependent transcriptional regulator [candidate division KSB1 bacterium]MDZ7412914.1 sigma-54 dependent transcriptional regulator [candidate division KSB1 bacterium]
MRRGRVLVVDNEQRMCQVLKAALEADGHHVSMAFDGQSALRECAQEQYDVVVCDLKMPGMDGLSVLKELKARQPQVEVILMTAYATAQTAVEAMKQGAYDYLIKPFETDELRLKVRHIVEKRALQEENVALRQELRRTFELANVVGRSEGMEKVYRMVQKVAPTDATVLLRGESGTGKELIARAIHELSPRADKPFLAVNCGALPESLLESELFGYEKGAFTGADRRKAGLFEVAGEGTLFLDEIGDVSLATQVKLLRVLQTHEMVPLGATRAVPVKARIIAATNRNLEEALRVGTFREDLYYRINVFPIVLPPLRERRDDIPELVNHFLKKHGGAKAAIEPDALAALMKYNWPGNVRELENVVERALIMAGGGVITRADLPAHVVYNAQSPQPIEIPEEGLRIEEVERSLILKALDRAGGNKTEAARLLGVTRRRLYSMMERLGLRPP